MRSPQLAVIAVVTTLLSGISRAEPPHFAETSSQQQVLPISSNIRFAELESQVADLQAQLASLGGPPQATFYDDVNLQLCDGTRWRASVDWLYWRPRPRGLDFAIVDALNDGNGGPSGPIQSVEFGYESGVRGRLGYITPSGWELAAVYTHFDSGTASATAVPPPLPGVLKKTTGFGSMNAQEAVSQASADASLKLNVFDAEIGTWLVATPSLVVRGFGGLRFADLDQDFHARYDGIQITNGLVTHEQEMTAVGLRGGSEARLDLFGGLSLFGSGSAAVMAGFFDTRLRETNDNAAPFFADVEDSYSNLVVVLEAAAGMSWCRGPFELSGGYEFTGWLNAVDTSRFAGSSIESYYSPNNSDLLLDGLFARFTYLR